MISIIIFISNTVSTNKLECVVKQMYKEMNIPYEVREHIAQQLNEQNLNNNYKADDDKIYGEFINIDFSTTSKLEEMLRDFKNQPEEFRRVVEHCDLSMKNTMEKCNKKFHHCELVDKFTAAKTCEKGYVRFNYSYCVPECDKNSHNVEGDIFVCAKSHKSTRSYEINSSESQKYLNYRNILKVASCPEGFTDLHNDICIANCPYGWEDLGENCLKPYFQSKEYEFISYSFQDDRTNIKEESY